jgi:hypothetical protein
MMVFTSDLGIHRGCMEVSTRNPADVSITLVHGGIRLL